MKFEKNLSVASISVEWPQCDYFEFMLQLLLVFYFVELLQQAYLVKRQDLCETAAVVSHVVVDMLYLTLLTYKKIE